MEARSRPYGRSVETRRFLIDGEEKDFLLQQAVPASFLGCACSNSEIKRLCSPSVNEGPPIALWHGPRPLRTPDDVIAWAKKLSSLDAPMADPARSLPVPEPSTSSPAKSLSLDETVAVLNKALARADATTVMNTLGVIARERGMSQIARETGLARESLYRSLDANGNPEFATVLKVLSSIGLRLEAKPDRPHSDPESVGSTG